MNRIIVSIDRFDVPVPFFRWRFSRSGRRRSADIPEPGVALAWDRTKAGSFAHSGNQVQACLGGLGVSLRDEVEACGRTSLSLEG
jgi:hypothetical protein